MTRPSLLSTHARFQAAVLAAGLLLLAGFGGRALWGRIDSQLARDLQNQASLLAPLFGEAAAAGDSARIADLCRALGRGGVRLTVILPDGRVAGDTQGPAGTSAADPARWPELAAALAGRVGAHVRRDAAAGERWRYVAVPVPAADGRGPVCVVRIAAPLSPALDLARDLNRRNLLAALALALAGAAAAALLLRRTGRSLRSLSLAADRAGQGEPLPADALQVCRETAGLAESMRAMAAGLQRSLRQAQEERNQAQAVLASMVEGVLAVDAQEVVLGLNRAGGRLLDFDHEAAPGRTVQEVAKSAKLTRLVQDVLAGAGPLERDVQIGPGADTWVQVHASGLRDGGGALVGALLVMNDVTRLRRLETMRRDFVANVSHELKTPITSIKGFVETLLDDAPADPRELQKFLHIIDRQADRLDAIITDLLALARLEQDAEDGGIELQVTPVAPLLERVARDLAGRWPQAPARLTVACPAGTAAPVNAPLLEQAVANLADNALKYSPPDAPVTISCSAADGEVRIAVADRGPGIAAEHRERVFERFYRIDKARSRQLGGTGLGLAIVKHIASAHRGRVELSSELGRGSTFTLILPSEVKA